MIRFLRHSPSVIRSICQTCIISKKEYSSTVAFQASRRDVTSKMSIFKLSDYDCVGFDLDLTLVSYNIPELVELGYDLLSKFMVERRGWNAEYLRAPLLDADVDFMQKGLVLDFEAGNVLKLSSEGMILAASHGTRSLSNVEIAKVYPDRRWSMTDALAVDPLSVWNGAISMKGRCLLDYFDMPVSLVFARAIDSLDAQETPQIYRVWPDILDGLTDMYIGANFGTNVGGYFPELKNNPGKYISKRSLETIAWLRQIKKKKLTFLLTGSQADYANLVASHALGEDWKSLFDLVVCYAKKPGFFTRDAPFVRISDHKENGTTKDLTRGGIYSQGNWRELQEFFAGIAKKEPRCLYLGDNLIQDVYAPWTSVNCDTVVISMELSAEPSNGDTSASRDGKFLNSQFWGSYFSRRVNDQIVRTFWCRMIQKYSKICIDSMDTIARNDLDHAYECFNDKDDNICGFYPHKPRSLVTIR